MGKMLSFFCAAALVWHHNAIPTATLETATTRMTLALCFALALLLWVKKAFSEIIDG